jgi:hypothetical protein
LATSNFGEYVTLTRYDRDGFGCWSVYQRIVRKAQQSMTEFSAYRCNGAIQTGNHVRKTPQNGQAYFIYFSLFHVGNPESYLKNYIHALILDKVSTSIIIRIIMNTKMLKFLFLFKAGFNGF